MGTETAQGIISSFKSGCSAPDSELAMSQPRPTYAAEHLYDTVSIGPEDRRQLRNFQWEFVRRNSEYQADIATLAHDFMPWFKAHGFWYERRKRRMPSRGQAERFYRSKVIPRLNTLCEKWQLTHILPPDIEFK